jgi:hypothetical protein
MSMRGVMAVLPVDEEEEEEEGEGEEGEAEEEEEGGVGSTTPGAAAAVAVASHTAGHAPLQAQPEGHTLAGAAHGMPHCWPFTGEAGLCFAAGAEVVLSATANDLLE